jgi:hypothetical protein
MVLRALAVVSLFIVSGCATTAARPTYPPRLQALEQVLAAAEGLPCTAGLQPVPAAPVEVGVFGGVPYHSFSNGQVEVNAYGDPGDLVGLEAGTQAQDPGVQQCLVDFVAATALQPVDQQRVRAIGLQPRVDRQPFLTVEVTPANGPDAYGAWWISLERLEAIAAAKLPPDQVEQLTVTNTAWVAPPRTYYRVRPLPYVRYRPYRPPAVRVYVPSYSRHRHRGYVHRAAPAR